MSPLAVARDSKALLLWTLHLMRCEADKTWRPLSPYTKAVLRYQWHQWSSCTHESVNGVLGGFDSGHFMQAWNQDRIRYGRREGRKNTRDKSARRIQFAGVFCLPGGQVPSGPQLLNAWLASRAVGICHVPLVPPVCFREPQLYDHLRRN